MVLRSALRHLGPLRCIDLVRFEPGTALARSRRPDREASQGHHRAGGAVPPWADSLQIPVDLLTASASGLDPDITPAAALFQAPRIAAEHRISIEDVERLIEDHTAGRTFGFLGEPRVNVFELNLALDQLGQG